METVKRSVVAKGWSKGGETWDFQGSENTLYDTIKKCICVNMHLFEPIESTTPAMNHYVNCGSQVIMITF